MKMRRLSLVLSLFFLCASLNAQFSLNITTCLDNTIYGEYNERSNGQGEFLIAGKTDATYGYNIRRALIKFDFGLIPSSAIITNVEVKIEGHSGGPAVIYLHKANKEWGEGSSNAPGNEFGGAAATTEDATWIHSKYNTDFWTLPGGDYNATPSATAWVHDGVKNIFSSPALITEVQAWLSGAPNYGWILLGDESRNGTAISMKSGNAMSGIPYITVYYDLPPRQVLINEVNPSGQWVELFNPGPGPIDVSDWYLCNGNSHEQFKNPGITILDGLLSIPKDSFLRVFWSEIGTGNGEVVLTKSAAFHNYNVMEDYVQYGAGNQLRAGVAVLAGVWDDKFKFVANPLIPGNSIGLKNVNHTSGEDTEWVDWEEQNPTPAIQNICDPFLLLSGNIPSDSYTATIIELNGTILMGTAVDLFYANSVELLPETKIEDNALFNIKEAMCPN